MEEKPRDAYHQVRDLPPIGRRDDVEKKDLFRRLLREV